MRQSSAAERLERESFIEPSVIMAVLCGLLASLLPLILWRRLRFEFPLELFSVPILAQASWLVAEYLNFGPDKVGFTFLGAIAVAVAGRSRGGDSV